MSEFFFGLGRGRIPSREVAKINRITRPIGAVFTNPELPGEGYRYWFAAPNQGFPFDRDLSREVYAALERAGITRWTGRT
jgi:hypothetical protein